MIPVKGCIAAAETEEAGASSAVRSEAGASERVKQNNTRFIRCFVWQVTL